MSSVATRRDLPVAQGWFKTLVCKGIHIENIHNDPNFLCKAETFVPVHF